MLNRIVIVHGQINPWFFKVAAYISLPFITLCNAHKKVNYARTIHHSNSCK